MKNELSTLSTILGLPLRLIDNGNDVSKLSIPERLHSGHIGMVVNRRKGNSLLQKTFNIVSFIILFYWLKIKLYCLSTDILFIYAVYPTLENPTCTYQLNSRAQIYSENNIISHSSNPFKRFCIRIFIKLVGFDPAVSSLVIVVKNNAVCTKFN